ATTACYGCHTVSEYGNAATVASGWNAVQDSAYHDVQCESCHGGGYQHVQSVLSGDVVRPLASVAVAEGLTNGCGECHAGEHQPFLEQWSESKHGFGGTAYLAEGGNASCYRCHEGRKAIQFNFGNLNDFVEKADTAAAARMPIVCATCHDPHSPLNEGQLRAPLGEPSLAQLCVKCHSRQGAPSPGGATRRGPHAAQGLLVIDEAVGWIPPGFVFDTNNVVGSHGTTANKRLCASCHVYMYEVTDAATGDFVFNSVGHTFEAVQCLDAQGKPTAGPCTDNQRNFKGCAIAGCHLTESAARTAFQVVRARMDALTDQLWTDNGNAILDTLDGGLLPKVLKQAIAAGNRNEMNLYDTKLTTAEGAIWNAQLAFTHNRPQWASFVIQGQNTCTTSGCTTGGGTNTAHKSSGEGVHNPFLLEALLLGSLNAVRAQYGVSAPPFDETPRMTVPPGVRRAARQATN
ncbi:MAG TPA: cytochrome c3 family protein, partial [Gemmatimonadales bacterium]|nr:cytochrome c3 family protein [Gemmatimonadales bacterium]